MKDKEVRHLTTPIELRSEGEGQSEYIEGYALKFEKWSERLGWFKEIISRTALDSADMSNVIALFNHQQDFPLARNTVSGDTGRLELETDGIGLKFRFKPSDTSYARDLIKNVRSGVINQCSFAFSLDYGDAEADEWRINEDEDIYERRINKINRIFDISLVTTPAYSDTEAVVGARSLEKVEQLKERRNSSNEALKMELELLGLVLPE
ncbi:HK97 family phage prohead protease [Bacillus velezensis]|uniref:HK97 family phage prohead protease n=1 Tax=Bacillus amyloliquefaciens group TaxID=1938374 RepID=UPI0007F87C57|nr:MULTISPECIES: HK97 family phage prohead protease [Bacillus amyloliquefaciens group]MBW8603380.1 HK97 family phage prohead protease [Bacillus amyloliquefaciens]MCT6681445.1 HK97 family phage prohead protease [Bacillus velezensis]MEC0378914.1 HK97 family phage prohead protease [Bacillus velezensis]MEC0383848.1 HK97 family phage prohead protease [Bacillus velezensis]MEC0447573.1 HK97 family phage prohead protease [Bacillus velezensis]